MFIEASAVVAILADEPEAGAFLARIEAAAHRVTGAHVRLEATINLARILGLAVADAQGMYDTFLAAAGITAVPITDAVVRRAVDAFAIIGKGQGQGQGQAAQLTFGDCLSYACAAVSGGPILVKGRDFSKTDLAPVCP